MGDPNAAGSSRVVELVVTAPRVPCQTFARWVGGADERGWVKRFSTAGRVGAYLSVAKTGKIAAGDLVEIVTHDPNAPTVRDVFTGAHA